MQPIPVPVSCPVWAHLVHDFPNHTEPARQDQHSAALAAEAAPRPENQEPRQRPSKTQRKPRRTRYSPRQHMDGEQLVSLTPCLTNSFADWRRQKGIQAGRGSDSQPGCRSVCVGLSVHLHPPKTVKTVAVGQAQSVRLAGWPQDRRTVVALDRPPCCITCHNAMQPGTLMIAPVHI